MKKEDVGLTLIAGFFFLLMVLMLILYGFSRGIRVDFPQPETSENSIPLQGSMINWLPYMQRWEREYGVPIHIQQALILHESGGQQHVQTVANSDKGWYAKGLFQVVDAYNRFAPGEDPFDPDTNAREGLGYLIGCNRIANGHANGTNWQDSRVLYDTFWCYHDGEGNYQNGYLSPAGARLAQNVLGLSGNNSVSQRVSSTTRQVNATKVEAPTHSAPAAPDNMCQVDPTKNCNSGSDWIHGWCHYQVVFEIPGNIHRGSTPEQCVEGLGLMYDSSWGR